MKCIDQTGVEVILKGIPQRVVSIVPSQTELLFDLGLDEEVVGITKFCVHPETWFRAKTRVGGTKKLDIGKIRALDPDLVIANKEENTKEDIEQIRSFCPVWISDIVTVEDGLAMIGRVADLFGLEPKGAKLVQEIRNSFNDIPQLNMRAAYLIWKNPYMVAGGLTYISSMMEVCGLTNVFNQTPRYPEVSPEELKEANPGIVLLSSEPYPFKFRDIETLHKVLPDIKFRLVDGEMFSWYGSRMKSFPDYVRKRLV